MRGWRRSAAVIVACALLVVVGVACSDDDGPGSGAGGGAPTTSVPLGPPEPGVLRLGVAGLDAVDPAAVSPSDQAEMIAADLLFDALTELPGLPGDAGPAGSQAAPDAWMPSVASSIEPDVDLMVWTVELDDGRTFSDGSPVRAADVKHSFERLAALGQSSLAGVQLELVRGYGEVASGSTEDLAGVVVVDETTVRIELVEPYAELPVLLASPLYGIVPQDPAGAAGSGGSDRSDGSLPADGGVVGSGPYRVGGQEGGVIRLDRATGSGPEGVELVLYGSQEAAYAGFEAGEVDWALVPAGSVASAAVEHGDFAFAPFASVLWFGLGRGEPVTSDVRMRRAVSHAIDRAAIAGSMGAGVRSVSGVVPSGVAGASVEGCGEVCRYDPAGAQRLVAEVYPDGGVPTLPVIGPDDPESVAVLQAIADDLLAVGIPSQVFSLSDEELAAAVLGGERGVFRYGWIGLAPTVDAYVGPPFLVGSEDNVVGLSSGLVNGLITRARATADAGERAEQYRQAEAAVTEEVVVVPIAQVWTNQVVSERVEGFLPRLDGTFLVDAVRVVG